MSGTRIPDRFLKSPETAKLDRSKEPDSGCGNDVAGVFKKNQTENAKTAADNLVKGMEAGSLSTVEAKRSTSGRNPVLPQNGKSVSLNRSSVFNEVPQNSFSAGYLSNMREPQVEQMIPAKEIFNQTAEAMGFPKDALSAAILVFSRLFSLSINSTLMGKLRREILSSGKSSSPQTAREKAGTEAETLALLSALDKGVVLSSGAIEHYARYFVPGPNSGGDALFSQDSTVREEIPPEEELRAIAGEESKKDPLLNLLNAIPGKNGQYWMVYPFNISIKGTELKVFIRILKRELSLSKESEWVIADIAGPSKQWRYFLRKSGGKLRTDIRVYPEYPPEVLKALEKRALRFLGTDGAFGEISLRNGGEFSSWAEVLCNESLPLVNKQV